MRVREGEAPYSSSSPIPPDIKCKVIAGNRNPGSLASFPWAPQLSMPAHNFSLCSLSLAMSSIFILSSFSFLRLLLYLFPFKLTTLQSFSFPSLIIHSLLSYLLIYSSIPLRSLSFSFFPINSFPVHSPPPFLTPSPHAFHSSFYSCFSSFPFHQTSTYPSSSFENTQHTRVLFSVNNIKYMRN